MEKTLRYEDLKIGDLVKLLAVPYANLKVGEIGVVTELNTAYFSVNGIGGCGYSCWELFKKGKRPKFHR